MKNFFVKTLIFLVFLVLFDTLFLVYEDTANCPGSVWAAFAGANIGYLMFLPTALLAPGARGTRVMAGTLYLIWARYFIAELIVAVTFVFWVQESTLWPVLAQSVLLAVFMAVNLVTSSLALARYDARTSGVEVANAVDVYLDEHFGNDRMERIYPNAKKVVKAG